MSLTADFLDTLAVAAERSPGPRTLPWPMPGNLGALLSFASFADWRDFFLSFRLPYGVPQNMTDGFERASKLYLLAWIDFDLMVAGEIVALSTLEHVLRDCYLGKEREQRRAIIAENAQKDKRETTKKEKSWVERISFADLRKYMIEHDALTDDKLPLISTVRWQRQGSTDR